MTTEDSPLGKALPGRIVVVDNGGREILTGLRATRKICMQIPLYFPFGLLLQLLPLPMGAQKGQRGCDGNAGEN